MSRMALVFLVLVLTAADCDGNGGGGGGSRAGSIVAVLARTGFVADAEASPGDVIPVDTPVRTNASGTMDFDVDDALDNCRLDHESKVRVRPSADIALRLRLGTVWCSKTPSSSEVTLTTEGAVIRMSDPVFGAEVIESGSIVKVAYGVVEVSGAGGEGEPVILGPNQQTVVLFERGPQQVQPLELRAEEAEAVKVMTADVPPPDVGPPDAEQSLTFARIEERGAIVAIDDQVTIEGAREFVTSLTGRLAETWGVGGPEIVPTDSASATKGLQGGDVDLFFTPSPPEGMQTFPVFEDVAGQLWFAAVAGDDVFGDALARFVSGIITTGDYATDYLAVFGVEPTYDELRSLLGF